MRVDMSRCLDEYKCMRYGVMVLWRYGVMTLWCYGVKMIWCYGKLEYVTYFYVSGCVMELRWMEVRIVLSYYYVMC
jgi:hypothetical protein